MLYLAPTGGANCKLKIDPSNGLSAICLVIGRSAICWVMAATFAARRNLPGFGEVGTYTVTGHLTVVSGTSPGCSLFQGSNGVISHVQLGGPLLDHLLPRINSSALEIGHPKKERSIFQSSISRCYACFRQGNLFLGT